jgi:hypothetical protein
MSGTLACLPAFPSMFQGLCLQAVVPPSAAAEGGKAPVRVGINGFGRIGERSSGHHLWSCMHHPFSVSPSE